MLLGEYSTEERFVHKLSSIGKHTPLETNLIVKCFVSVGVLWVYFAFVVSCQTSFSRIKNVVFDICSPFQQHDDKLRSMLSQSRVIAALNEYTVHEKPGPNNFTWRVLKSIVMSRFIFLRGMFLWWKVQELYSGPSRRCISNWVLWKK